VTARADPDRDHRGDRKVSVVHNDRWDCHGDEAPAPPSAQVEAADGDEPPPLSLREDRPGVPNFLARAT
jgi:hypothetical protein